METTINENTIGYDRSCSGASGSFAPKQAGSLPLTVNAVYDEDRWVYSWRAGSLFS